MRTQPRVQIAVRNYSQVLFYHCYPDAAQSRIHQDLEQQKMPDSIALLGDQQIDEASRAMKAMSHPLRLRIVCILADQEVSVQDIVDQVGTSQSNISQHLAMMREKGVLRTRKDANRVYYRLADVRMLEVIARVRDVFCGF